MKEGKIRNNSIIKFLNLCNFTLQKLRHPSIEEIMKANRCSKSNAYNYRRALKHLYSEEMLEYVRKKTEDKSVQQRLG